jgi:hypothetical protein
LSFNFLQPSRATSAMYLNFLLFVTEDRHVPQVHYSHNDVAVYARFCYSLGGGFRSTVEGSLLGDLRALVEFAQAGSIAGFGNE